MPFDSLLFLATVGLSVCLCSVSLYAQAACNFSSSRFTHRFERRWRRGERRKEKEEKEEEDLSKCFDARRVNHALTPNALCIRVCILFLVWCGVRIGASRQTSTCFDWQKLISHSELRVCRYSELLFLFLSYNDCCPRVLFLSFLSRSRTSHQLPDYSRFITLDWFYDQPYSGSRFLRHHSHCFLVSSLFFFLVRLLLFPSILIFSNPDGFLKIPWTRNCSSSWWSLRDGVPVVALVYGPDSSYTRIHRMALVVHRFEWKFGDLARALTQLAFFFERRWPHTQNLRINRKGR